MAANEAGGKADGWSPDDVKGIAATRFGQEFGVREPFLNRARRCAALTIPSLFRPMGSTGSTDTPQTWQSFGAYCVNNITSKLSITMFPPGIPFIRIKPSKQTLRDLNALGPDQSAQVKLAIQQGLAAAEQEFVEGVDEDGDYTQLTNALKHLVVGGNHGIQFYHNGTLRDFSLERFVTIRDKAGNLLEFIIEDQMAYQTLPPDVRALADQQGYREQNKQGFGGRSVINLYTRGVRIGGKWHVNQECYGFEVPNTHWVYDDEAMPFLFLTLNLLAGEDYGRSYCEDFEGDLQSVDGYEQTIQEGSMAAAMFIRLVKPGGVTSKKSVAEAQNGDVITGDPNDVATLENKIEGNFQSAEKRLEAKYQMLAKAFLLNSAVQRDGERVTAEEIRYMAQELQDALGGVYSSQVTTFQRPYAKLKMAALQRTGRMTVMPKKSIKVAITTGAAALSRNAEAQALSALASPTSEAAQQAAATVIKWPVWFNKMATALSLDADGLLMTEEEVQQQQQAAQQQEQLTAATPSLINQGGALVKQGMQHASDSALSAQDAAQQQAQASQAQGA